MGVLNVTPDSFSDGGRYLEPAAAAAHGRALAAQGADIVDVGGESTRPGAVPVSAQEETARVLPVIRALAGLEAVISIDTWRAGTAAAALAAGAGIVNDVRGFQGDPDIARVAAEHDAVSVLMHWESHDLDPSCDIFERVRAYLSRSVDIALAAGLSGDRLIVDPGIGFGKTPEQNLRLIRDAGRLKAALGLPVLIGASRKRMIIHYVGQRAPDQRLPATLALHVAAVLAGADVIRAHDVAAHRDALAIADALRALERD